MCPTIYMAFYIPGGCFGFLPLFPYISLVPSSIFACFKPRLGNKEDLPEDAVEHIGVGYRLHLQSLKQSYHVQNCNASTGDGLFEVHCGSNHQNSWNIYAFLCVPCMFNIEMICMIIFIQTDITICQIWYLYYIVMSTFWNALNCTEM